MKINNYPQYYDIVESRYSCRKYAPTDVPREIILAILEAAQKAPSACNRQPWSFIVITDAEGRQLVQKSYDRPWIASAPVYIIACGLHDQAWVRPADGKDHTDIDVAIAIEHMCLAATSLDLATCWVCNFDTTLITQGLNLPPNVEPIAIIPLGYPDADAVIPEKKRKPIDEIVKWGKY